MRKGIVYVVFSALFLTVKAGSVGVYAPAILPGVTLADNVWQKYDPAPFGSNTTARIQAFYDMMCERVDVMSPDYYTSDDKTNVSFPGCPSPAERAIAANAESVFPLDSQYRALYASMCSWLSRDPYVTPAQTENDGIYLHPYWQSPLCHEVGISVTTNGIATQNTDVYPCALSRFGYSGAVRNDISNALSAVASAIGVSYTAGTNGITASIVDDTFCRFIDAKSGNASYVDEIYAGGQACGNPLLWAPLYSFDRICNDLSSHNLAILRLSSANYPVITGARTYTISYVYDIDDITRRILAASKSSGVVYVSPSSVTVTATQSTSAETDSAWATASASVSGIRAAAGYIDVVGGSEQIRYSSSPFVNFTFTVSGSSLDMSSLEPVCCPKGVISAPQYLSRSHITAVGRAQSVLIKENVPGQVSQGAYTSTETTDSPAVGGAISTAVSNSFSLSSLEIESVIGYVTNRVNGRMTISVSGYQFTGSFDAYESASARLLKVYDLPYVICENEYNFTGWSGHVAQPTSPLTFLGPQTGYGDGDGGSDDFDVWVDATVVVGTSDGSRERPFRTIDAAIASVNPNGGAHAVTNRTPKIGIRPGTYAWPTYFQRSQGGDTPYPVRLIGIGTDVTLDKQHKGSSGNDIPLARRSSLENLNLYVHYDSSNARSFCSFILIGCKVTGTHRDAGYDFLENSYVYRTLFDGLSAYCSGYQTLAYGCTFEDCLFYGVNLTSGWRPGFESCVIENSLVIDGKWGYLLKGSGSEIAQSTCYLPDITDKTPPTATNCLFFVDGMVTTEDFRRHNVVTNAALFSTAVDPTTLTPTTEYQSWKKMGFQGGTRTE